MGTPKNKHARRYYRVAKQRLEEAELILGRLVLPAAAQYLAGYAAECMLKALVLVLVPENERPSDWDGIVSWLKQQFGHDIDKLAAEMRRRGQNVPKDVADALGFIEDHWRPESRYVPGPGDAAEAREFLDAVTKVVEWADRSI